MTVGLGRPGQGRLEMPARSVLGDTAGSNTIAAFDRHANGTLTPLPGSPFTPGGAGTGAGLASQGAVQIADGGRFLLAADAGSNQVSALRIQPDGGSPMQSPKGTCGSHSRAA